jgi:hypothetical protein
VEPGARELRIEPQRPPQLALRFVVEPLAVQQLAEHRGVERLPRREVAGPAQLFLGPSSRLDRSLAHVELAQEVTDRGVIGDLPGGLLEKLERRRAVAEGQVLERVRIEDLAARRAAVAAGGEEPEAQPREGQAPLRPRPG